MTSRRRWLLSAATLGAGVATVAAAAGPGVRRYHVRPQVLRGLPPYDYQPPQPPPVVAPVYALSEVAVPLGPPTRPVSAPSLNAGSKATDAMSIQIAAPTPADRLRVKVYQFRAASLAIDHCVLSRMVLTTRADGLWRLTLRADQNYRDEPISDKTAPNVQAPIRGLPNVRLKQTGHLKRNLFIVHVRGLGLFSEPLPVGATQPVLGKPVLFAFPEQAFWVQNGVPLPFTAQGFAPEVAEAFDLIDRAELEFTYR
jgi:hypothetical protein